MTEATKSEPWVKFVARAAPQVTNPCVIHLKAFVVGELIHSDLVDPIRADRRRAFLDGFYDAMGRQALAAAGIAERQALDQEILDVARRTLPEGLLKAWHEVTGEALPVVSRPRNPRAPEEVDDEDTAADEADDEFDDDSDDDSDDDFDDDSADDLDDDSEDDFADIPGGVPGGVAGGVAAVAPQGTPQAAWVETHATEEVPGVEEPPRPRLVIAGVVRPQLFFTPWVSGLAVERRSVPLGTEELRPRLYLQWADGLRQAVPLRSTLLLPDGRALRLTPDAWGSWGSGGSGVSGGGNSGGGGGQGGWPEAARQDWLAGRPAPPSDPKPLDVFRRLVGLITEFVDLTPGVKVDWTGKNAEMPGAPGAAGAADSPTAAMLAIWTLLTYCYPAWNAVPYLAIVGPPESGKSTLLGVLGRLCFRPMGTSIAALAPAAGLFRALKCGTGTLLVDQADGLRQGGAQLREAQNILLQGSKRGGMATQINGRRRQEVIDVFGPKALACIGGLTPALASRCIPVRLTPAPQASACPGRSIDADDPRWGQLTGDLHALALAHGQSWPSLARRPWRSFATEVQSPMGWRQQEIWQPMLALAAWLEENGAEGLLAKMASHARACKAAAEQERVPEVDEVLLRALTRLVMEGLSPTCADLLAEVKEEEPEVARVLKGSPRAVAVVLGRYGLTSTHGRDRRFRMTQDDLRRVEKVFGVDLEICAAASEICAAP